MTLRQDRDSSAACNGRAREGAETGSPRLYTDGVFQHPDGKAKLLPLPFVDNNERPDEQFPFWLNSGRVVEHFHTRTRTGKIGNVNKFRPRRTWK